MTAGNEVYSRSDRFNTLGTGHIFCPISTVIEQVYHNFLRVKNFFQYLIIRPGIGIIIHCVCKMTT